MMDPWNQSCNFKSSGSEKDDLMGPAPSRLEGFVLPVLDQNLVSRLQGVQGYVYEYGVRFQDSLPQFLQDPMK